VDQLGAAQEFIARFLRHVLPPGFKRIRHYGLLAPGHTCQRLAAARAALQTPAPQAMVIESAQAFLKRVAGYDPAVCPHCGQGQWQHIGTLAPQRRLGEAPPPCCRDGPA
jgi:hypothetical protein